MGIHNNIANTSFSSTAEASEKQTDVLVKHLSSRLLYRALYNARPPAVQYNTWLSDQSQSARGGLEVTGHTSSFGSGQLTALDRAKTVILSTAQESESTSKQWNSAKLSKYVWLKKFVIYVHWPPFLNRMFKLSFIHLSVFSIMF